MAEGAQAIEREEVDGATARKAQIRPLGEKYHGLYGTHYLDGVRESWNE